MCVCSGFALKYTTKALQTTVTECVKSTKSIQTQSNPTIQQNPTKPVPTTSTIVLFRSTIIPFRSKVNPNPIQPFRSFVLTVPFQNRSKPFKSASRHQKHGGYPGVVFSLVPTTRGPLYTLAICPFQINMKLQFVYPPKISLWLCDSYMLHSGVATISCTCLCVKMSSSFQIVLNQKKGKVALHEGYKYSYSFC